VTSRSIAAIPDHATGHIAEGDGGELDRNARPIVAERRHRKDVTGAVPGSSRSACLGVASPVALAQIFGNDDLERFAHHLGFAKAENPLCAAVPEADESFGIRVDDRVRRFPDEHLTEPVEIDFESSLCGLLGALLSAESRPFPRELVKRNQSIAAITGRI
jgi:hypothetical protein